MNIHKIFKNLSDDQINDMAKGLAIYFFRNGVIEDMHADGKLSQNDIKLLNKDIHNNIASLLTAYRDGMEDNIMRLIAFHSLMGNDWDKCTPDLTAFKLFDSDNIF